MLTKEERERRFPVKPLKTRGEYEDLLRALGTEERTELDPLDAKRYELKQQIVSLNKDIAILRERICEVDESRIAILRYIQEIKSHYNDIKARLFAQNRDLPTEDQKV